MSASRDVDLRRATIDHHADAAAVRFTKSRDAKKLAECVAHCGWNQMDHMQASDRLCTTSNRLEGDLQIVDQIAHVFDADRKPDE